MTSNNFNNLMDGESAKWVKMFDKNQTDPAENLTKALVAAQNTNSTNEEVETARSEIKKLEVEIPTPERQKMDNFIKKQRDLGTKERTIRRKVQSKWNITVI